MMGAGKQAMVLGITGGYGRCIAEELVEQGWSVRALVRDVERARATIGALAERVELVLGDVLESGSVVAASAGCQVIVHGVNVPYDRWDELVVPIAREIAGAAATLGATILFPGNVYNFAPGVGVDESTEFDAPTRKGALRIEIERVLEDATEEGARVIVLRGGDFFGVGHDSSWMFQILGSAARGGAISMPQVDGVRHAWCYLPDFASAHVALLDVEGLEPYEAFHFAGHVTDRSELTRALRDALGDPSRKVRQVPWIVLRVMGVFQPVLREVVKMRYLWDNELTMSQDKLVAALGPQRVPRTSLVDALSEELRALRAA